MKKIIVFSFMILFAGIGFAQLISVEDLSKIIKNPDVIVLDARPAGDYMKTHIAGAVSLDISTLNKTAPVDGMLKSTTEIADILGKKGITTQSKIVVYCKTGVNAGRLYWTLKYMGCKDVKMLDGQMDAWFSARKPITKNAATPKAVKFVADTEESIIANKAYVTSKMNVDNTVIIDSRAKADYDAGHIGNAINIHHELLLKDSKLKSANELTTIFNKIPKNKEVILYCKTSTTAGLVFFAMKSVLNYPNVKVYNGAWNEWSHK
jgi:thiosulfate/3-mercaptopyruvate sulfurtransferase